MTMLCVVVGAVGAQAPKQRGSFILNRISTTLGIIHAWNI